MTSKFLPNDNYMIVNFQELEVAFAVMVCPEKRRMIENIVSTVQAANRTEGPARALMTLVGGISWLTDDPENTGVMALLKGKKPYGLFGDDF